MVLRACQGFARRPLDKGRHSGSDLTLDLGHRLYERYWSGSKSYTPACHRVRLGTSIDDEGTSFRLVVHDRHRDMTTLVDEALVALVGYKPKTCAESEVG